MKAFYRVIIFLGICAVLIGIRALWVGYNEINNSESNSELLVMSKEIEDLALGNSKPDPCIGAAHPDIDLDCLAYNYKDRPIIEARKRERLESYKNRLESDGRSFLFFGIGSLVVSALLLTFGFGKLGDLSKRQP